MINFENLDRFRFFGVGKYQIPQIEPVTAYPDVEFIPVNYAKTEKRPDCKNVHFFVDDYQFVRFWNTPDKYIPLLRRFRSVCAPDHQPIQGRQYSNEEYERLNQRLQRPIGTLNCHHFATPIILGVSKPVHSDKELREINARSNAPVEYRGKTMTRYEASQKQRQLETAIRYAKDERGACVAAGDKIGAAQARKRSAALGREYKSFCEKAGLTPRPERTRSMTGPTVVKV